MHHVQPRANLNVDHAQEPARENQRVRNGGEGDGGWVGMDAVEWVGGWGERARPEMESAAGARCGRAVEPSAVLDISLTQTTAFALSRKR